jgi:glycosyltransferase involved in cell wall biosynthesis
MSGGAAGNQPLVVIGVPVYNGERFLEATLDCLLAQTYRNIEIIVSDNASTDGTEAICMRYAQLDPRVKPARTEINVGASGNIRRLAGMIRGEYFKLSNADDLVDPEFVARCVEVLESDRSVALACTLSRLIDMEGRLLRNYQDDMHICESSPVDRFMRILAGIRLTNSIQGVGRAVILREVFLRHGSYDGADMVMLAAIAARGGIHQIQDVMFDRRMHEWSASAKSGDHKATQEYLDPATSGEVPAYLTRIGCGYVAEGFRAPLPAGIRMQLVYKALRSLISQRGALAREWMGVLRTPFGASRNMA